MSSFGTDFVIISDVQQPLPNLRFADGPAIHHATIKRGLDEYIVFRHESTNKVFIEKVERNKAKLNLQLIEDDIEWNELAEFCKSAGLLEINGDTKHAY